MTCGGITMPFKGLYKKILLTSLLALALALLSSCQEPAECTHGSLSQKSVVAATCQSEGYTIYSCNNCTFEYKGSFVAPTEHVLTSVVTEPGCNTEGYTTHSCECGYTYKSEYLSPLGHSFKKTVVGATCTSQGYTSSLCSKCFASFVSDLTPQLPHNMETTVTEPDCDNEGFTKKACKSCDYEFISETVAPLGHSITSVVTDPTCKDEGFTTNSCENCDYEFISDIVAPIGHSFKNDIIEATCTSQGYTVSLCSACTASFVSDLTPTLPHDMTATVVAPSCNSEGFTKKSCKNCDYAFISDQVAPLGHSIASAVVNPQCEEQGFTNYFCLTSGCNYSYASDFTPPAGHTITLTHKHASAQEPGYIKHSCPCGYEYFDYIMPTDVFTGAYADSDVQLARGIDVSKWNGELDFAGIKAAGFDFVIIKAGSIVGKDPYFEENYAAAKAAGLDVGAYFYSYAKSLDEIDEEAELFLAWLEGKQFEYPVYFDIEDPSQETLGRSLLTDMTVRFVGRLQSEGYFCGVYVNNNWLMNLLDTERITTYFDVWYARYKSENIEDWNESWGDRYGMWQYTDKGEIGEHECLFDMNFVYRDYPTLIKEWGYNGFSV